jgi:hypothetical protein
MLSLIAWRSFHPDGTFTELTVANTAAFSRIDGLEAGRPMFAVVAFEGIPVPMVKARCSFRVQTRLLRYVLLHVDGKTLPRPISTQARDPFQSNPVDNCDDSPRAMDMPLPMPVSNFQEIELFTASNQQSPSSGVRPSFAPVKTSIRVGTRDLAGPQWP